MKNNKDELRIVKGNSFTLRVTLTRKIINDGNVVDRQLDDDDTNIDDCRLIPCVGRPIPTGWQMDEEETGVILVPIADDLPCGPYGLKVIGHDRYEKKWRFCAKPGEMFIIVPITSQANVPTDKTEETYYNVSCEVGVVELAEKYVSNIRIAIRDCETMLKTAEINETARQTAEEARQAAETSRQATYVKSAAATTLAAGSDATAVITDNILTIGVPKGDKGDIPKLLTAVTFNDLKALRDAGGLEKGLRYRITDYTTTTTQEDTQSAGHQYDIIVTALSPTTLSEEAEAIMHEGDTYFAKSRLAAWCLWYSLDNDASRFAWADTSNGRGVVYRMIDEWGNDCPYDFKNIQFKRYKVTKVKEETQDRLVGKYLGFSDCPCEIDTADSIYCYTFSGVSYDKDKDTFDYTSIFDTSLNQKYLDADLYDGESAEEHKMRALCKHNRMASVNIVQTIDDTSTSHPNWLNNIVSLSTVMFGGNNFDSAKDNVFSSECFCLSMGGNIIGNKFSGLCSYNIFSDEVCLNTFSGYVSNNTFSGNVQYCTFEGKSQYCSFPGTSSSALQYLRQCGETVGTSGAKVTVSAETGVKYEQVLTVNTSGKIVIGTIDGYQ